MHEVWRVDILDFMMVRAGEERVDNAICAVGVETSYHDTSVDIFSGQ